MLLTNLPALYYRLLKNDTATRILANPQLRTSEGIAAKARFGERVPVPVTTFAPIAAGGVQTQPITSFNYEPIGVNIDITPRMHHDDAVTLALKIELSSISGTGFGGLPTFGNRSIDTVIRLKDGETNMLAGLIRDEERTSLASIPGLGDIPVIGRLFGYNHKETQETDIILTLTPRIVRVLNLTEEDLQPFRMGRDGGAPVTDIPTLLPVPLPLPKPPGGDASIDTAQPVLAPAVPTAPGPAAPVRVPPFRRNRRRNRGTEVPRYTRATDAPSFCSRSTSRLYPRSTVSSGSTRLSPSAASPAAISAMPDRMSRLSSDLPRSFLGPVTMMRCGSQRNRSAPIPLICSRANSRNSYIQSCTSVAPSACVASTVTRLTRSLGNPGHSPVVMRPAPTSFDASTLKTSPFCVHFARILLSVAATTSMSTRPGAAHFDVAAGDRADHRPTAGLDVIAVERLLGTLPARHAFDADGVRPLAVDADAHAAQELAQLDDVGLAGRVADLGHTGGRGRREQARFRCR